MTERDIFIAALQREDPAQRQAYLDEACAQQPELRQQVENLLQLNAGAGSFLDAPLFDLPPAVDRTTTSSGRQTTLPDVIPLDFLTPSTNQATLGHIGPYEVTKIIGRGGMGIVLKARDAKLSRIVAIKVMAPELASNPTARKRFVREAQAAAAVVHQHIVTIHAVDEDRLPYLVMEYIDGQSLQDKIDREGHLKLLEILRIGQQIASGLAAAHAHGLMHRDVKPANILLENGVERVRITDFGLARAVDDVGMTRTGEIAGTPQYMSPEQAQGLPMDGRSDLFSFGCVLYAMCTGRSPFRAETAFATARRVCEDTPRPIREVNPEIPGWLVEIIGGLLAKSPDDRFQTAAEVAELLSQHLAHLQHPSSAPLPVIVASPKKKQRAPAKRHLLPLQRLPVALAAAALVCLAVSLALSEATGVTQLSATVIRIFTPSGTLVVEAADPAVKVTIEGDGGLTITGAGLEEIRLRPGNYKVHADKDGKSVPLETELVNIATGGREVIKVKLEASRVTTAAKVEKGAFVLLAGGKDRKFETLAAAVQGASNGDTIEIRGNGPFVTKPVEIRAHTLTIRAADGFRPVIRLSPQGSQGFEPMLSASGEVLVLEGLELQRLDQAEWTAADQVPTIVRSRTAAVNIANCRFLLTGARPSAVVWAERPRLCTFRNCELNTASAAIGGLQSDARVAFGNCMLAGSGSGIGIQATPDLNNISIQLTQCTCTSPNTFFYVNVRLPLPSFGQAPAVKPIRLDVSGTVLDIPRILGFDQVTPATDKTSVLEPADAEATLARLLEWRGQRNLYATGSTVVKLAVDRKDQPQRGPTSFEEWKKYWGSVDVDSLEDRPRFQGGDLLSRLAAAPEKLTPDDFRLRADSPGYRAGMDGKDFGADVDLVGPGPAYERWKKTPEYQQWLKDTGQASKAEAAKAEPGAFLVLDGKGVAVRTHDTLANAVQSAGDGDTIEIRGNGPFISQPIVIVRTAVTIRAGDGFRPVIKLSPEAVPQKGPLLQTSAALTLEGLELHRAPDGSPGTGGVSSVEIYGAPLRASNCRFRAPIWANQSPDCLFRNCEFLTATSDFGGLHAPGAQVGIQNCVYWNRWGATGSTYDDPAQLRDISFQIERSTFVGPHSFGVPLRGPLPQASQPIRLKVTRCVFDCPRALTFDQTRKFPDKAAALEPAEAESMLLRRLQWQGEQNLFAVGSTAVGWSVNAKPQSPHGPKSLEEWKQFWGTSETDSLEGRIRFQGGNLSSRSDADLDRLTPDDFRLRADSPGYRAGPDGKDLGADVDLVGPGPAYERWKKTPEYQQWLKDTGQAPRAEAAKAEPGAFLVLDGKGVGVRTHDTLAKAVQNASDGDTIEIRGNGPFVSQPINIQRTALTIRAGEGFRPVVKLSPDAVQRDAPLLATNAALVLEGLELHRARPEAPEGWRGLSVVQSYQAPLRAANCRFRAQIFANYSPVRVFHNCEFLSERSLHDGRHRSDAQVRFQNCLYWTKGIAMSLYYDDVTLHGVSIEINRSTFVNSYTPLWLGLSGPLPIAMDGPQPILLAASESIFDAPPVLGFDQRPDFLAKAAVLPPTEAEAAFLRLMTWRGERNLFPLGSASMRWGVDGKLLPPRPPAGLEEWKQFWGAGETDSVEGSVRFQGGNLLSRGEADLDQLTPDDFRLRPDSPGYRAGPDGKDLGADVDLVGPGPAYERWKKTPEYQQWLKDTGQAPRAEAPKPEPMAFVVLTAKGIEIRKFDTLADAVQGANDGDAIEIRGNGPFVSKPIRIGRTPLTIRAGTGFRPVLKPSSEGIEKAPLFTMDAALVLEGLDVQADFPDDQKSFHACIQGHNAPLRAAHCRFDGGIWMNQPPVCVLRNCELVIRHKKLGCWGQNICSGERLLFENCLFWSHLSSIALFHSNETTDDVSIRIKSCTFATNDVPLVFFLDCPIPAGLDGPSVLKPLRLEVSRSIFDSSAILAFSQRKGFTDKAGVLPPAEAEALLLRLLEWRGERNLYPAGSNSVQWYDKFDQQPPHGPKGLDEWKRFSGSKEADSRDGRPRFHGGSPLARENLDQLTPDDLRLRPDSDGYQAGPDGKDLGADVDLVGPGAAYERWKKTPEYQQWLEETGQQK
jgi:serine/threonine protein kinase